MVSSGIVENYISLYFTFHQRITLEEEVLEVLGFDQGLGGQCQPPLRPVVLVVVEAIIIRS